jgi:hypothetical protein
VKAEDEQAPEPSFEEIAALLAGDLDEARADRVREALARDPELAQVAADLGDPERLADLARVTASETDAAWAGFVAQLDGTVDSRSAGGQRRGITRWIRGSVEHRPLAMLAATLVVGLGVGGALVRWQGAPRPPGQILLERIDRSDERGPDRGEVQRLEVTADVGLLVLLLSPPPSVVAEIPALARYRIWRGGSRVLVGDLRQQDEGLFALALPATALPAGSYRIGLFRLGEERPFATYDVEVKSDRRR